MSVPSQFICVRTVRTSSARIVVSHFLLNISQRDYKYLQYEQRNSLLEKDINVYADVLSKLNEFQNRERRLRDDFPLMNLQNPWDEGRLFVRRRDSVLAALQRGNETAV
ncbi:unnamed protein product [Onchocerca flexuosa]|uniref:Uncharacterized protein n=1 Tax=Onchocerca flexuosa TaxID=387005 RepID=A0A183I3K0_9BILA|nr:unnamed protein product [Onchocerca flexuosa]